MQLIDAFGLQDSPPKEPCSPDEIRNGTCKPRVDEEKACKAAEDQELAERQAANAAAKGDAVGWYMAKRRAQDELYNYHKYLGQPLPDDRAPIPPLPPNGLGRPKEPPVPVAPIKTEPVKVPDPPHL